LSCTDEGCLGTRGIAAIDCLVTQEAFELDARLLSEDALLLGCVKVKQVSCCVALRGPTAK
jgi:hypothetical protein